MSDTVLAWGLVAAFLVAGIAAIVVMNWFHERHRRRKWASGKLAKGASAGGAIAAGGLAAGNCGAGCGAGGGSDGSGCGGGGGCGGGCGGGERRRYSPDRSQAVTSR